MRSHYDRVLPITLLNAPNGIENRRLTHTIIVVQNEMKKKSVNNRSYRNNCHASMSLVTFFRYLERIPVVSFIEG